MLISRLVVVTETPTGAEVKLFINVVSEIATRFRIMQANSIESWWKTGSIACICACVRKLVKHSSQVTAVLVIVQVRCCPAVMLPLQSPLKVVVNPG